MDDLDRLFDDPEEDDGFSATVRASIARARAVPAKAVPATPVAAKPTPIPAAPIPDATIQTYDEGGRGRKACPACKKYVGGRLAQCACGHVFGSKPAKVRPQEAPLALARETENAPVGRLLVVSTPSGKCPVTLESASLTDVETWAHEVCRKGRERGVQYAVRALRYWVRQFFDINGKFHGDFRHTEACSILDKMFAA